MSCRLKNTNPDKFGDPPRTNFDLEMMRVYNPLRENYHAPVWNPPRTVYDKCVQKVWCQSCSQYHEPTPQNLPNCIVSGQQQVMCRNKKQ